MKNSLIINPFIQIQSLNEPETSYFLVAPRHNEGLQKLKISKSEQSNLYELFLELSQIRFDLLDVEKDIDESERKLLFEAGVLVEPESIPDRPLFVCPLNTVEPLKFKINTSSLIVNSFLRFQPVNIKNFNSWIQEKHFSPYQSSAWIKDSVTEIEFGYWLDKEQAEIVSKFTAGEKLSFEIDNDLLSKLVAAEILIFPEIQRQKEENYWQTLNQAKEDFSKNNYFVLRSLLPEAQMKALRNYYREYIKQGFMPFGDDQVDRRFYQHNEPLARFFHQNLTRLMSSIVGEEVKPSYVYAASYKEGASLKPHVDREACEYSFSFQVDYEPEQENHLSPWALYLSTKNLLSDDPNAFEWENFPPDSSNEDAKAVYLASGDCLVYKGCELVHYRYPLPAGHQSTSLFFHYVPKDFEGNLS